MKTRAAGSTALSSDYDITFMGKQGAFAVQEFNKQFRAYWGKEAGTVFDTNVYAEDVLPGKDVVVSGKDDISLLGTDRRVGQRRRSSRRGPAGRQLPGEGSQEHEPQVMVGLHGRRDGETR